MAVIRRINIGQIKLSALEALSQSSFRTGGKVEKSFNRVVREALNDVGYFVASSFNSQDHDFISHTGELEGSIDFRVSKSASDVWTLSLGYMRNGALGRRVSDSVLKYAKYQIEGTGIYHPTHPHVIKAKTDDEGNLKYMRFYGKHTKGGMFSGKYFKLTAVRGIEGQDFLSNAVERRRQEILSMIQVRVLHWVNEQQRKRHRSKSDTLDISGWLE